MSGALRAALRWLWMLAALAVIAYAALVALGRELLPRLDGLQPRLDSTLSQHLGAEVGAGPRRCRRPCERAIA